MSADDTFFGSGQSDRTVLRPTPGGRSRQAPAAPPPASSGVAAGPLPQVDASDTNRLVGAAAPLLALAVRLARTVSHPNPESLFRQVAQEIKGFEAAATAAGARPEAVLTARYALCTLLDETVLNTPWGSQSVWASQTLLNVFHNEGWGGEKFFQILERVLQQPAANLELLELMYLCIAMGLQGKYRVQTAGKTQLDAIEANVLATIRAHRGEVERDLSPHWIGVADARPKLARYLPLWVVGAVTGGVALAIYFGLLLALNTASNPVAAAVAGLGRDVAPLVERAPPAPQRAGLRELLGDEIRSGALEVRAENGTETVVLREGLFASGSGDVVAAQAPLIEAVGRALNQVPGQVLVTGHTDNVPIRTLRFPSNWHLSQRRAEAVTEILARVVDPARLSAEARADTEPLAPNDTPANRALNRRVEIMLLPGAARE
jgi:type VI secretion system protein ImpK